MTALGRYVCGKCGLGGYHTPRHAISSWPHRHHLTFPHIHTQTLFLIVIIETDHLEFILLPKNRQQPHKVSKRNLVNRERFNAIFF
ncbi:uncharacterized protein N7487_000604 [Penicillium crustosum]|uniref:uncharacterized protein n=1 Tax=Penicillium crustosum TaxID=36656 RepID=UPI00238B91C0|nr:uncharacterized protein N7487_000604 [Penicillium crustosum]KAJ5417054.1 hypothetical protein N7487_000604 [Penicillium crustosum]